MAMALGSLRRPTISCTTTAAAGPRAAARAAAAEAGRSSELPRPIPRRSWSWSKQDMSF